MSKKRKRKPKMAQRVVRIRRACGDTQVQFAARMKMAERTIQYWESGTVRPRAREIADLKRLAKRRKIAW